MTNKAVQQKLINVVFCMGSSCFSRGGNRALVMLQMYLEENDLDSRVHIEGKLCQGQCQEGPNITINGKAYRAVDPGVVLDLVKHHLEISSKED